MKIKTILSPLFAAVLLAVSPSAFADEGNKWHQENVVEYPLIHAAAHGDIVKLEELLEDGFSPDTVGAYSRWSALHVAAANGYEKIVRMLLLWKPHVIQKTNSGETAEMIARRKGHIKIADMLAGHYRKNEQKQHKKAAGSAEFTQKEICQAYLAYTNGKKNPKIYAVLGKKDGAHKFSYRRDDGKLFHYLCKLAGDEIKWMNLNCGPLRWSNNTRGFFRIEKDVLHIREKILGEIMAEKHYKLSDFR